MRLALFLGLLAFLGTCQDDDDTNSNCIDEKIRQIMSEPPRSPRATITVIQTKTTQYFYVSSYCCDMFSELLDSQCNYVCNPDGGISGRGNGDCPEISDEIERHVLWEDTRQ